MIRVGWTFTLTVCNQICLIVFTIECITKISASGRHAYFGDNWNCFDFTITVLSWVHTILELVAKSYFPAAVFRIIRTIRVVGRIMSLINLAQADGVQIIMVNTKFGCLCP